MASRAGVRDAVAEAIEDAYNYGLRFREPTTPHEPDFIVGLIVNGVPRLRGKLAAALKPAGLDVRVGGVYCHGSPKVEHLEGPEAGGRCELGDLLIVTSYRGAARTTRRALLLQAKISTTSYGATPQQQLLYDAWPRFKYYRTRGLSDEVRSVAPHRPGAGAQFCEFGPCRTCDSWEHPQTPTWFGSHRSELVDEITDLVLGHGGRPVRLPAGRRVGWNRVIEDLLRITAQRTFNYSRKLNRIPAGSGDPRALAIATMNEARCIPVFGRDVPAWYSAVAPGATGEVQRMIALSLGLELEYIDRPPIPLDAADLDDDDRAISVVHVEVDVAPRG